MSTVREAIRNRCEHILLSKVDESTRRAIGSWVAKIVAASGVANVTIEAAYDPIDQTRIALVWHGPEFDLSPAEANRILERALPEGFRLA
jgi:hypothetical protein